MKITKKEFIDTLCSAPSVMLGLTRQAAAPEQINSALTSAKANFSALARTVTAKRSNHLEFSDGSRLYFDGNATRTYESHGGCVYEMTIRERGADWAKHLYYYVQS